MKIIIPKLRFKEFKDNWKYYTFEEIISSKSNTYNPQKNMKDYKCIELEHINQEDGTINGYTSSKEQKSSKNFFSEGSILFGKLRPYLKKYWLASFSGVCSSEILVLNSKDIEIINNKFIFYLVQIHYFIELCKLSTGSKMPRADWSYIKEQSIAIPTVEEQEKISKMLSLLDKKIELQKQKIEALKLYKKGLLQKIMNDNGQKVKIKDILEEYSEKTTINNQYESISSTKEGLFLQKEYFNRSIASENNIGYKILKINQVVLSPQNLWMGNINYNDKYEIGIVSPSYKIFNINNEFNKYYIFNLLKSEKALYYYTISSEQGASIVRRNLNIEAFEEITFNIPDRKTQNIIGMNIKLIDFKIKLNENKFNYLYNYKKSLLQQMFI